MDGKTKKEMMRQEREKLRGLPFKKKLGYVWDYYKAAIGAFVAVIFVVFLCFHAMKDSGKNTVLSAAFVNAEKVQGNEVYQLEEAFASYINVDEETQTVIFDDSYLMNLKQGDPVTVACQTKLTAAIQAETLDVLFMPGDVYENYLKAGAYQSLEEILGEEFLEQNKEIVCMGNMQEDTKEAAYGIKLTGNEKLRNIYGDKDVYFAVTARAKNLENIKKIVQFLLS